MRNIILLTVLFVLLASCKVKDNTIEPSQTEYFIFGTGYGECVGNCSHFFQISNSKIYPDDMLGAYTQMKFSSTPLSNDKYLLAKSLLDSLPQYLTNNPNITIGCPDCVDQGKIYIEFKSNGVIIYWNIDTNTKDYPKEIESYITKLKKIVEELN
jgi:hypothetical protein